MFFTDSLGAHTYLWNLVITFVAVLYILLVYGSAFRASNMFSGRRKVAWANMVTGQ